LKAGKDEHDVTVALRGTIQIGGRKWRLTTTDKKAILNQAKRILGRDDISVVPLSDVVRLIDRR
jgi:hypothetical protein